MSSVLNTIRANVIAALIANPISVGGVDIENVFDAPVFGLDDPDDVPAVCVSSLAMKSERVSKTSHMYTLTYQLVVRVIVQGADDSTLADNLAEAHQAVCDLLLSDVHAWAPTANSVVNDGSEFTQRVAPTAAYRTAAINVSFLIEVDTRYQQAPSTGSTDVHVEISPKPATTAGWESKDD